MVKSYDVRFVNLLPYAPGGKVGDAWRAKKDALQAAFRYAVAHDFGTLRLPREVRDQLFKAAWDEGHGGGYDEVAVYYERFARIALAAYAAGLEKGKGS